MGSEKRGVPWLGTCRGGPCRVGGPGPSPRRCPRGILHKLLGAGAQRCWKGRWGRGRGRGPCGLPWEAGVQAALGGRAHCGCLHRSGKCHSSLGLCFPAASIFDSEAQPSADSGCWAEDTASRTPRPGSRAPVSASAFTAGDGPEGLRPPLDSALVLCMCVYTCEHVHVCVSVCMHVSSVCTCESM